MFIYSDSIQLYFLFTAYVLDKSASEHNSVVTFVCKTTNFDLRNLNRSVDYVRLTVTRGNRDDDHHAKDY